MAGLTQVAAPPERAVLVYDGECTFCLYWVHRWRRAARDLFDFIPYQEKEVYERFPELDRQALEKEVHLVEPNGRVSRGAEAALRAIGLGGGHGWLLWAYKRAPAMASLAEAGYGAVARHRGIFSWLTRIFWGAETAPPTFVAVRWLFLRGMGVCYLAAFLSLWVQIENLVGPQGILPVADQLSGMRAEAAQAGIGAGLYWQVPTFCWLGASAAALGWQCLLGVALSALVMMGIFTGPCLAGLWMLYLSLTTACGPFLGYQWDALLLEAGFLSCWVGPWRMFEGLKTPPPRAGRWLMLWLLFRLMFTSGCVKLASHDLAWHSLTALQYHYETQPLPTWAGWYAHQMPPWAHTVCALLMFGVELVVPFLILGPRRLRLVAFWSFCALMGAIQLTGNYGFFNLLTGVLCIWLLDDQFLLRWVPKRWRTECMKRAQAASRLSGKPRWWEVPRRMGLAAVMLVVGLVTIAQLTAVFASPWPRLAGPVARWIGPFRSVNRYGLFAMMTTTRPEIIVEGSQDGILWKPYDFKHKAGDLNRAPGFTGLHMPRLDWQMWFAALGGDYRASPWFAAFARRLLEGAPEVLELLESNPFPEEPPRLLRGRLYDYRFTDIATQRRTGAWWARRLAGEFCPPVSLPDKE